jgi:hypothetical protein
VSKTSLAQYFPNASCTILTQEKVLAVKGCIFDLLQISVIFVPSQS